MSASNVHALPLSGLAPSNADIVEHVLELAEQVKAAEWGDVITVIVLIEDAEGNLHRRTIGQPTDRTRVCGLLTTMAARIATGAD